MKYEILDGIFDGKGTGETVELEKEHGDYYVAEGLLRAVEVEIKAPAKRAKKDK